MSDPVTNAEVEDVLSSIRRLVSEEKRPVQAAKPAPQNDRLVLTPALRIEEDAEPPQNASQHEVDQVEAFIQQEKIPETEAYQLDQPVVDQFELRDDADGSDQYEPEQQSAGMEDDYAADPYNFDDESDVDGESDAPLTLQPEARSDLQWAEDTLNELDGEEQDEAAAGAAEVVDITPVDSKAATLSAKIEALESAIGGIEDEFEPDEPDSDAYAGTQSPAMAWEDDMSQDKLAALHTTRPAEGFQPEEPEKDLGERDRVDIDPDEETSPEAVSDPAEDAVAQIAQESLKQMEEPIEDAVFAAAAAIPTDEERPIAFASDTPVIDEEALREMVGEIVRSELQGSLGERITRNVRKLVRREIHRALTTQDLE